MAAKSIKTPVSELSTGLFVADLDRPWCQTPFPLQGFYIRSQQDIDALKSYCKHVYIDRPLERTALEKSTARQTSQMQQRLQTLLSRETGEDQSPQRIQLPPIQIRKPHTYESQVGLKKGVRQAKKLMRDVDATLQRVFAEVREGRALDIHTTESLANSMAESVIRNPDALLWLSRVQKKDEHTYSHALSASIWGLVLGRHLGLEPRVLKTLSLGLLLSQIGKAKLPEKILENSHYLSAEDFAIYKTYVDEGVAMLKADPAISPQIVTLVEYHRERHNGSGFPKGVGGEKIPLLAKIAGIVDYYQEMIEPRPGLDPIKPSDAVSRLYELRNIEFQEDLIERFIDAIGVYPTGTMVELSDHRVGVVMSNDHERKLWPTVLVVMDEHERKLRQGVRVSLREVNTGKNSSAENLLHVTRSLPFGAYGIDPGVYLGAETSSRWSLGGLLRQ